ncbi:MAG: hypothetical protein ACJ8F7_13115 [Gemmataceae bacterium]
MPRTLSESDARFHGGSWMGYTLKPSTGGARQPTLTALTFADGVISGTGSDETGVFAVHGRYDLRDGKCIWLQTYSDRREVIYNGYADCQGMWGMWFRPRESGPDWKGGFHLVPEGSDEPTPLPMQRTVDCGEGVELGGGGAVISDQ